MKKRKGTCKQCMKSPRVLNRYYLTQEWMCAKCEKAARSMHRRSSLLKDLSDLGTVVALEVEECELARLLENCNWVHRYVKDVFDSLTGMRSHKLAVSNEDIDLVVKAIVPNECLVERVASLQRARSDEAHDQMARCSTRKSDDPYAFLYLAEHKAPLVRDGDFSVVEKELRLRFGELIPFSPPAQTDYNFTFLEDVPLGMRIAYAEVDVAGVAHRKEGALRFCYAASQRLKLKRDDTNTHDRNAIQVIGCFQDGGMHHYTTLGYLPAKLAAAIVTEGATSVPDVLLNRVWISSDGFIRIVCDVIQPI